ncbi:Lon protease family protein [Pasteurellaceae bacterium LIM206]|nr:Lon protease family protein [Pasteurellaceae bacterium LIM206]
MNLSSSSKQILAWQDLLPVLNLSNNSEQAVTFFDLQPRASSAISHFLQNQHRSLLVLEADDQAEYAPLLQSHIAAQLQPDMRVTGVRYMVEQADSFSFAHIYTEPAQSMEDNFAAQSAVLFSLFFDQAKLFGTLQIHPISKDIKLTPGLVHQANGGVLILSVAGLLAQFDAWLRLKQILTSKRFDWYAVHPSKPLPCEIPSYPLELKLILLGNREELAAFAELESELYALSDYSELESYFSVEKSDQQVKWAQYVRHFAAQQHFPPLTPAALQRLYQLKVRTCEDRSLINISPLTLKNMLSKASLGANKSQLEAEDFERAFRQTQMQQGFLREQTYADILHEQVYIPTEGEAIGQINGLSVIEYQGTPLSFGEPSRISCIVQFGDGEIIDVDRKSELAGNIHGKGMMIAESCLADILNLPSQLPFSASLVFEQSYGEIDGDSASLAEFCVLTSALAGQPLPQSIAVTGAIDQFGLVHAVGGVNDKIEGFFAICQQRGLTGKQGVIIPTAAVHQLSLSQEVVEAVKADQFTIWIVEDVYQACEILFQRDLVEEENKTYSTENQPLSRLILQRIESHAETHRRGGLLGLLFGRR